MTNDEKTGLFTYESYLEHLESRVTRANAELVGFLNANPHTPGGQIAHNYLTGDLLDHYTIGLTLGQMYLKKKEQGT